MLSKRIVTILPDLTFEESIEITKLQSIAGILPNEVSLVKKRPFRSPHHTLSKVSLMGGGRIPKPGEITLAHYGVLFMDEFPEFSRSTLEALRGPLEDKEITISRINSTITYPCNFIFIATMNPCPCGYLNDERKECVCTPNQIANYRNKISGPILDRIDMHIEVARVEYKKLKEKEFIENSKTIRERVNCARKIQAERYKDEKILSNAELTSMMIDKYCVLEDDAKILLEKSFEIYNYSARSYSKILKMARTIADLDFSENIKLEHVAEAIQYRVLDRGDSN